jgi:hypothetical protein
MKKVCAIGQQMEESVGQDTDRKGYQDRLMEIREKKLKQLR